MKTTPKKTKRQKLVALIACLLAILMLLPLVATVVTTLSAGAVTVSSVQSEIDKLKNKNKSIASQKSTLNQQLKEIKADKNEAISKKNVLEQQINLLQDEIDNLDEQLEQYAFLIEEKKTQVAENQAEEETQFALFCDQVRAMEKQGDVNYLTILFSSTSFSDLLNRLNLVNSIADYSNTVRENLRSARAELEKAQAELETAEADTQSARDAQSSAKAELQTKQNEVKAQITTILAEEKETQSAIDELNQTAKDMDAQVKKLEQQLQQLIAASKQSGSTKYNFDTTSGLVWPLPAERVSVTSFFGPRIHPITGKQSNHSGTDIGAYTGTNIYAAHAGVVLASSYENGYGNYVVVSRGDGMSTLYAHMSKRLVSAGDVVTQGQTIGLVGSTGRSTAPHLHFEVRINGTRVDALKYYPNVKWKNNTGFPYS